MLKFGIVEGELELCCGTPGWVFLWLNVAKTRGFRKEHWQKKY